MRLLRAAALALCGLVLLTGAATAEAASTTSFTEQFVPSSLPEGSSFALTGDRISSFSALLRPTQCASPADWQNDSDDVFKLALAPGADVELSGGSFSYSGTASSDYYGAGSDSRPYGGKFTISGQVNPDHTFVNATVTMSDAQDPFVTGCSGTYKLIAIPTVSYSYTPPGNSAYQGSVNFDYAAGVVRKLRFTASFMCGNGVDEANVDAAAYGYPTLQANSRGVFSLQTYVLDEYQNIVHLTLTGRVRGRNATGRISVSEPAGGFTGVAGVACGGSRGWTAAKPVPPPPPGPVAYFEWAAIRVNSSSGYRYYFAIDQLTCAHHATRLLVTVLGRTISVGCRRSAAFVSGPLAPGRTYEVRSQAVRARRGHILRRGQAVTIPLKMPGAGDLWVVVSGLPGNPPD